MSIWGWGAPRAESSSTVGMEEPEKERLHDGNPWIQVSYGGKFHYLNPEPEEIYIEDIAHALSLNCRFNGHTERFYSVAQHSCMVAKHVMEYSQNPIWGLAALLHDAAEAYIPDMPRPIKGYIVGYAELEKNILHAILKKMRLPDLTCPKDRRTSALEELISIIKVHDNRSVITEKRDFLLPGGPKWDLEEYFEPYKEKIHALTPANAEREFMIFFRALEEWRGSGTTSPAWGP